MILLKTCIKERLNEEKNTAFNFCFVNTAVLMWQKDVPSGKKDMNNTSAPTGEVNKPTDKTDIPTPTEVLLPEGTKVMSVEEERFSALIPDYSTFKYVQDDGTYIYVADGEGIPYVYFNVLRDIPIGANQFLEESVITSIQENYGERLYEMGSVYMEEDETADAISEMISDSWKQRNKSTELELEKYSDALLGYSRVEDTDTGEIYWTDTGFEDRYLGERYKPITDEQYSLPTAGILQIK